MDHAALLSQLQRFDGWALSTSADALPSVLALCVAQGLRVRVAAWFRDSRAQRSRWPVSTWEPVVFAGGRQVIVPGELRVDALTHNSRARTTDDAWVIGAKPARFCFWVFQLLGAAPNDALTDLFPGSGGVGRAWELFASQPGQCDEKSCRARGHVSQDGDA